MLARKSGFWLCSSVSGTYHYHNSSSDGHSGKYLSKCKVHKISSYYFVGKKRYILEKIKSPEKICKNCLRLTNQSFDIFNYIDDIEEKIDELLPHVDFICKIPNIEVDAV